MISIPGKLRPVSSLPRLQVQLAVAEAEKPSEVPGLRGLQEVRCREPDEEALGIQEEEGDHHSQVGRQSSWAELEDLQGREVSLTSLLSER